MSEGVKGKHQVRYWQKRSFRHLPEMRAAKAAGLFPKKEGWRNVVEHEIVEAEACDILAEAISLPQAERRQVKDAAALHDVFKRKEKELMERLGPEGYTVGQEEEGIFLKERGYGQEIIKLAHSVGHGSLLEMVEDPNDAELKVKDDIDLPTLIIHYVDDITLNNDIVPLNIRIDYLEANPRYQETNEQGRKVFAGRTYFEVQREVSRKIEAKLASMLGIEPAEKLPDWIKGKILERIEQEKITQICIEAAKEAFRVHQELGEKGKEETTTNQFGERTLLGDWECEEAVIRVLKKHKLKVRLISEEHGDVVIGEGDPKYLAVLDGIDGSFQYKAEESSDRRYGTMFAIFDNTDPKYKDAISSFIMEHPTERLYFAQRGQGAYVIEGEKKKSIKTSNVKNLDSGVRLFVDEGYEYNKSTFSTKLQDYKPRCTFASSRYYADVASGHADVVCECTRKGNLELATAYLLVTGAGGAMITEDGEDLGTQDYLIYGQGKDEYKGIISAATRKLAEDVRQLIKVS